jgi:hypothetical protein
MPFYQKVNYLVHYQFKDPVPPFPNNVSSSDAAAAADDDDDDNRNLK